MPITISDCAVCGATPKIEVLASDKRYIQVSCSNDNCDNGRSVSEFFHDKVIARWNKWNVTIESMPARGSWR